MRGPARRPLASTILAAFLSFGLAATAMAAPSATLKVKPIPIPGFPDTGDILGVGSEVESQVTISGNEYGGFPSPLTGIHVYVPAGVTLTPAGFATCEPSTLEVKGAAGCPKNSSAGPQGEAFGVVAFGDELVHETVTIEPFFTSNGLVFYVDGSSPVSLQIVERAHWIDASAPFSRELLVTVPLVETVPGAPYASVLSFKVTIGAAYRKGKKTVFYITNPKICRKGGFPVRMELRFLSGESVTPAAVVPCPSTHRR